MDANEIATFEVLRGRMQEKKDFLTEFKKGLPSVTEEQLREIIEDPIAWYEKRKKMKKAIHGHTYFCTLTTLPGFKDYKLWLQAIYKVLTRKFVLSFTIAAEHLDTNLHCHILIKAKQQVQKKHFHSYCKATGATIIDVRKVTEDNGIEDYMELENPTFNNFSEFQNFILTHFNAL